MPGLGLLQRLARKRRGTYAHRDAPRAMLLSAALLVFTQSASSQSAPQGLTSPQVLPPFDPAATACAAPPGRFKSLAFLQDNEREFMQGVSRGLSIAARERGLNYSVSLANNDVARMVSQAQGLAAEKIGSVVVAPIDPTTLAPALQGLIRSGAYVGSIVAPPATSLLNAPQYLTGAVLGDAAATYIKQKLNGKAKVVLLTHDGLQFLAPRFVAMRDSLKDLPGVEIVADISPATVDKDGGRVTMEFILLAHPIVDVVLGADTVVLGALSALRKAGKARPTQFLGGIDGEPEAIAELKTPNSPYKSSVSLASPVFGFAMGQHAADWLEGKSIPQGMDRRSSSRMTRTPDSEVSTKAVRRCFFGGIGARAWIRS